MHWPVAFPRLLVRLLVRLDVSYLVMLDDFTENDIYLLIKKGKDSVKEFYNKLKIS